MNRARRILLSGIAPAVLSLFHKPIREVFAASAAPRRLLVLYMPNCSWPSAWNPTGGVSDFKLPTASAPLEAVRQHMVIFGGLQIPVKGSDNHSGPIVNFMSGGHDATARYYAARPTIDQQWAKQAMGLQGTPIPSLQLMADTRSNRDSPYHRTLSYGYDQILSPTHPDRGLVQEPLYPENQPHLGFERVFAGAELGASPRSPENEAAVMDFVKSDLQRLMQRLPAAEKQKLERHAQGLAQLEMSLSATQLKGNATVTLPGSVEVLEPNVSANHKKVLDLMFELTKQAFLFDRTRVVTFGLASANSYVSLADVEAGLPKSGVHALAHEYMDDDSTNPAGLVNITRWYASYLARQMADWANTPEEDGTSLLDNTVVVLFSDVAYYHTQEDPPLVLFGGKNLGIRGNRFLRYTNRHAIDLWPTLAPLFGAPAPELGPEGVGPLPELVS